jgi:hypothetical protein
MREASYFEQNEATERDQKMQRALQHQEAIRKQVSHCATNVIRDIQFMAFSR